MAKAWDEVKNEKKDIVNELKTFEDTDERTKALTKVNGAKFPLDKNAASAMKTLYEAAAKAKPKPKPEAEGQQNIKIALTSYTKPKFMHNGTNAGKLPVWTFTATDTATKKSNPLVISMTRNMSMDEPTAKKEMSAAAIEAVKKVHPKANITIDNTSLSKGDND